MSDDASSKPLERRKVFRELIPLAFNVYSTFRSAGGAQQPEGQRPRTQQDASPRSVPAASGDLPTQINGVPTKVVAPGVVSIELTPFQVFGAIKTSLKKSFLSEGAREEKFTRKGSMRMLLTLPKRVVDARFVPVLTEDEAHSLLEEAKATSSETWVFTTTIGAEKEVSFDPLYLPDGQKQVNNFRVIPLTKLLPDVYKRWHVIATGQKGDSTLVLLQPKVVVPSTRPRPAPPPRA